MRRPIAVARVSWLLLAVALCLPTDLRIGWDGLPLCDRGEFVVLLFGLFAVMCGLARRLVGAGAAGPSFRHAAAIGILAAALIAIKLGFPASAGIPRCWWAPHVASGLGLSSEACLGAAQPRVSSIDFGPGGEPWRPGLHNTATYGVLAGCPPGDATCRLVAHWRARNSLPFRATFWLGPAWLPRDGLRLTYAGRLELELRHEGGSVERVALPYTASAIDKRIDLPRDVSAVRLIYWNYSCQGLAQDSRECLASEETPTLTLAEARLTVDLPESPARSAFRWIADLLTLGLIGLIGWATARALWRGARDALAAVDRSALPGRLVGTGFALALLALVGALTFQHSRGIGNRIVFAASLSSLLCVTWGSLVARRAPDAPGSAERRATASVLCALPMLCLWLWTALKVPPTDGFALQSPGDDWLTFTSEGYFLAAAPRWFDHPHFAFSKPLFIYFRALLFPLLGEGTTYLEILLRFLLACLPILLVPLGMKIWSTPSALVRAASVVLFAYAFFWTLRNFSSWVLVFPAGMSEIPAWLFTLIGGLALLYSIDDDGAPDRGLTVVAALATALGVLMRPQAAVGATVFWALAIAARPGAARRRLAVVAAATVAAATVVVLVHALPVLGAQRAALMSYLGWTTDIGGVEPIWLETFRRGVTFEREVPVLLVLGGSLGVVLVWRRSRGVGAPLAFALCYLAALATHLLIKDRMYYPRHYVLIAHTAAYLTLYCGTRVLVELATRVPRRGSP